MICLPTKRLTRLNVPVHSTSNGNLEVLDFEKKEKREKPRKSSWSKGENQKQTQPSYGVELGFEPWLHGESGVLYSKCSYKAHNASILPPYSTFGNFFLGEGRGCLCEKEKDFKACFLGK